MKKIILVIIFILSISSTCYAQEEILKSQKETFNISSFEKQSQKYKSELLEDVDINELLSSAIKGKIDNSTLIKRIINIFFRETRESLKILRKYINNNYNT